MAGNSTISITYKLEGDNGGFKKLAVDAEGLRKVLGGTVNQAEKLKTSIINFAALSAGLDSISQSLNTLQAKFKELSDAYAVQETAERKLETVMRQRMGATDAEIDSIKKLASAQQEIGVIGDEVQLSGAQQVATFLKEKASLDVLLPAMNNLLAQQKGLNATTQDAVQVGNLMGKAMQGQTGALTRVGITFTAAQEQVMKFGTESERAAMLAQIITDNVGNMNQQLAQTDSGKQKQLENTLGDVKEKMGALVSGALPYVTIAANTMMALTATMKFSAGIRVATIAVTKFFASGKIMGTAMAMIGVRGMSLSFVIRALTHSLRGGAGAAVAMKVALRGLMISTGIGIAIAAITTAIEYLVGAADDAADSAENLADSTKEAQKEFDDWKKSLTDLSGASEQAIAKEIGALDKLYKAAMDESKSRKERIAAAEKLKATYPDTFANLTTEAILAGKAAKAYDKLKTSIIEAATAKAAQSKIEQNQSAWLDLELERKTLTDRLNSNLVRQDKLLPKFPTLREAMEASSLSADNTIANQKTNNPSITTGADNKRKYAELRQLQDSIDRDRARLKEINARQSAIKAANNQLEQYASTNPATVIPGQEPHYTPTPASTPEPVYKENAANLKEYDDNIKILEARLQTASLSEAALINPLIAMWREKADAIRNAGKAVENSGPVYKENAANIKEIGDNLSVLQKRLETATIEEAAEINKSIKFWQEKDSAIRNAGNAVESNTPIYRANATNLAQIQENIQSLQDKLQTASIEEAALLNKDIEFWQKKADAIRNAGLATKDAFAAFSNGWGNIKNVGSGIDGITGALSNNGNAWQKVTGIVDGFLQVFEGIKSIVSLINTLVSVTQLQADAETTKAAAATAAIAAQGAEAATADATAAAQVPVIAANKAATASFMELASAAYFAAHAYIPFAGFGIASGFVSASAAMVKAAAASVLTPFANGGIVSGPTVGLIGEYAGASSNPEVVAPLDKLRKLINPVGQPVIIGGTLRAAGRELVCVLANETRIAGKSGRRTNIKI